MALSNIFKEPRREITETLVGLTVVAPLIVLDVRCAHWMQGLDPKDAPPFPILLALAALGILVVGIFGSFALIGIHAAGEKVCDALARKGLNLRPTVRYR